MSVLVLLAGGGGQTIFELGNFKDWDIMTIMMLCLIIFTIILEFSFHKLEHSLAEHRHYMKMLEKMYKELTILGIISFVLLMITQGLPNAIPSKELIVFEWVHVWIFFVAVVYVFNSVLLMVSLKRHKTQWDDFSVMTMDDMFAAESEHPLTPLKFYNYFFGQGRVAALFEFHYIRLFFIRAHKLKASFDYAKFLRRSASKYITEALDTKEFTWMGIFAFLFLNLGMQHWGGSADKKETEATLWSYAVFAWLYLLLNMVVLALTRRAHIKLVSIAGCDNVEELPDHMHRTLQEVRRSAMFSGFKQYGDKQVSKLINMKRDEEFHGDESYQRRMRALFPCYSFKLLIVLIDLLALVQCFYLSLVAILHVSDSWSYFGPVSFWFFLILEMIPHIIVTWVVRPSIVKHAATLSAIYRADENIINEIIANANEALELRAEVRDHMRLTLLAARDPDFVGAISAAQEDEKQSRLSRRNVNHGGKHHSESKGSNGIELLSYEGLSADFDGARIPAEDIVELFRNRFEDSGHGVTFANFRAGLRSFNMYLTLPQFRLLMRTFHVGARKLVGEDEFVRLVIEEVSDDTRFDVLRVAKKRASSVQAVVAAIKSRRNDRKSFVDRDGRLSVVAIPKVKTDRLPTLVEENEEDDDWVSDQDGVQMDTIGLSAAPAASMPQPSMDDENASDNSDTDVDPEIGPNNRDVEVVGGGSEEGEEPDGSELDAIELLAP